MSKADLAHIGRELGDNAPGAGPGAAPKTAAETGRERADNALKTAKTGHYLPVRAGTWHPAALNRTAVLAFAVAVQIGRAHV